eukprot:6689622-Prymnesium_polylepis.1
MAQRVAAALLTKGGGATRAAIQRGIQRRWCARKTQSVRAASGAGRLRIAGRAVNVRWVGRTPITVYQPATVRLLLRISRKMVLPPSKY